MDEPHASGPTTATPSAERFDVVVIGGGPAGEHAVGRLSDAGLSTALVEEELVCGECSYYAFMPSNSLLRPGRALAEVRSVPGAREAVTGGLDVAAALARRDWMTSNWDDASQVAWVAGTGAVLVRGHGRLVGERVVEVTTPEGGRRRIEAGRGVILATGSSAARPPIEGLATTRVWDNRAVTAAATVPRSLAVIGGGVVGVEMAQAWRRLGAEVTVLEGAPRLLGLFDPFVSEALTAALVADGIDVRTGVHIASVRRDPAEGPVTVAFDDGAKVVADELLVATGRRPRSSDLGLETVGLEPGRFVEVDDDMAVALAPGHEGSGRPWLYAVGDVNGRALFTHVGKYQARLAVAALSGRPAGDGTDAAVVAAVVFSDPEIASVGLSEQRARELGRDVVVVRSALESVAAAAVMGEGVTGVCQLVLDASSDVVVGATFVGPGVAELVHAATVAIVGGLTRTTLRRAVPSFPTFSEVWLGLLAETPA